MEQQSLLHYLDQLLATDSYQDYCPNGLQIAGRKTIKKIVTGVTACQALIDAAAAAKADTLLVHHGFFWRGENPCITGIKYHRIRTLIKNNINLIAYHLPLDGHETYGNNAQLANLLNIGNWHDIGNTQLGKNILLAGEFSSPITPENLNKRIEQALRRPPLHINVEKPMIKSIAWCTGSADKLISQAPASGVDAFISGEISEQTTHIARELNIHYFAAGHHATERYGVKALGAHLADTFPVEVEFIDIDNPA